jgi:cobaltochelatase CobS
VAARLNWPLIRINLDGHVSRIDLVGRDAIVLKDGARSPNSAKACCPGRCSVRCALSFDEYDAGRPT